MTVHRSLEVQQHIDTIVRHWPALLARLGGGGGVDRSGVHVAPGSRMLIDADVSRVIGEVSEWAVFLARVLMDEVTVERVDAVCPWTFRVAAEPWAPRSTATPDLLHEIATERIGHFTEHEDEQLALSVADDSERLAKKVVRTAIPSGRRRIRLGIPCLEHGTTDLGERVPCKGQYTTVLAPDESIGDLVCTKDDTHRMTPLEWQRAQRRDVARDRDLDALINAARVRYDGERMRA